MESFITTVTQKGQITLPVAIRRKAKIKTHDRVEVKYTHGLISVSPVIDFIDLGGSIKAKKGLDPLKAREYMETHYKRI